MCKANTIEHGLQLVQANCVRQTKSNMSNNNDAEVLPPLTENVMVTGADDAPDTDDAVPYI